MSVITVDAHTAWNIAYLRNTTALGGHLGDHRRTNGLIGQFHQVGYDRWEVKNGPQGADY
jgi:hypothetical protein